jgi:hypothetical protein
VQLVADIAGYWLPGPGSTFTPVAATRILDTRRGAGPLPAGEHRDLVLAGGGQVPAGATAVVLNVTAVHPQGRTHVQVYPASSRGTVPHISNLNVRAGITVPNLVIVKVGDGGAVRLRTATAGLGLVVDLAGYYRP